MYSIYISPPLIPTASSSSSSRHLSSLLTNSNSFTPLLVSFQPLRTTIPSTIIRMGGGPRTFPGGVSKWQWKRMQAKKAKQLLKARLCRERQIYEMRKRAELRAAVTELERPWEVVERAPTLFSVSADEQLKTLADRFQRPGGYDLWSETDGPQLFHTPQALPSARFFPKGVVHSVKPYGAVAGLEDDSEDELEEVKEMRSQASVVKGSRGARRARNSMQRGELDSKTLSARNHLSTPNSMRKLRISSGREEEETDMELSNNLEKAKMSRSGNAGSGRRGSGRGNLRNNGNGRNGRLRDSNGLEPDRARFRAHGTGERPSSQRGRGGSTVRWSHQSRPKATRGSKVYDMSLKQDGSYQVPYYQQKHLLTGEHIVEFD